MTALYFAWASGLCFASAFHAAKVGHAWLALFLGLAAAFDAILAIERYRQER